MRGYNNKIATVWRAVEDFNVTEWSAWGLLKYTDSKRRCVNFVPRSLILPPHGASEEEAVRWKTLGTRLTLCDNAAIEAKRRWTKLLEENKIFSSKKSYKRSE